MSQPKCLKTSIICSQESFSAGAVKNMKSRFEQNTQPDARDTRDSVLMTPKSIIKKFEQMSRDGASNSGSNSNPVSAQTSLTNLKTSTSSLDSALGYKDHKDFTEKSVPSIFPSLKSIVHNPVSLPVKKENIYADSINPRSIIQKFERMVKNNGQKINELEVETLVTMPKSVSSNTNFTSVTEPSRESETLTFISSVISDASPRSFEGEEEEDGDEDSNDLTYKGNHTETDELYEELSRDSATQKAYEEVNL